MNPKSHSSQSVCGHVVNDSDKMWTHTIRDHLGLDCWLCQNCQAVFDTHRLLNKHYERCCVMLNAGEVEGTLGNLLVMISCAYYSKQTTTAVHRFCSRQLSYGSAQNVVRTRYRAIYSTARKRRYVPSSSLICCRLKILISAIRFR